MTYRTQNWKVTKPVTRSPRGIVATQNRVAGEAGAQVLASGGNAVDAAVATGFALAACEPWNSGLGGIGYMLVCMAGADRVEVIDFSPISPRRLDPADFPLVGGMTQELFTWPAVLEDRNVHGPMSIAVPGHVDGMGLALERFGTKSWREVLSPAIQIAERGMAVDWYLTLKVATTAKELSRYPSTRAVWLPDALPPVTPAGAPLERLVLTGLAETLKQLARAGRRDFYEGTIARSIVADLRSLGGIIDAEDLAGYHARVTEPTAVVYRDSALSLAPRLTAGPSMARTLDGLARHRLAGTAPDAAAFVAYAHELRAAFDERLRTMGDTQDPREPGCTTHFNVVDRDGNMVAVTQTLLSVFGSRLVLPLSGILMNNGVFWFDPRPGVPNSLGPGKRPLTNMCPVIARRDGRARFALGGSGGRKIFPAVLQLTSMLVDYGMSLEQAWHTARIDASGGEEVGVDPRLPADVRAALEREFALTETELVVYPTNFACPSAVMRDWASGENSGIADVMSPWSGAVSEEMV
ncbi:MAG: gamma-glutamyltransferase [Betaproteobacteria bacterium]|nr:MAG: gamma-glutamyltransferase [Betaproteobacteria bacterium]